jgi:hypothetical protein
MLRVLLFRSDPVSDVLAHATGYSDWDLATNLEAPEDLAEWAFMGSQPLSVAIRN